MMKAVVALAFLALNFYVYHFFASSEVRPPRESFAAFPRQLGTWSCARELEMGDDVEEILGVTDYLLCSYQDTREPGLVNLYVGYHASQVRREGGGGGENSIHPPRHCLPGSGWDVVGNERVAIDFPGLPQRPAEVNRLLIAKGEDRRLVYYWYQSRGRVIADDWKKIVLMTWDRARVQRTDGSLVRFTIPLVSGQEQRAEADFREMASQVLPLLPAYVPE